MISRHIKYLGQLTVIVSLFSYSPVNAADNFLKRIFDEKGGPFAGMTAGGSIEANMRFQRKQACQLVGANCSDADRLDCESVQSSVFSGIVECWNGKEFSLVDYKSGQEMNANRNYKAVANLIPNNTDRKLVIAQGTYASGATLMNENGQVIAEGDILGCKTFEAAGEDTVNCVKAGPNGTTFRKPLKVSDLEAAKNSSAKLSDVIDDMSINICSVALKQIDAGNGDGWVHKMKSIQGIGKQSIDIYREKSELANKCVIYPEGKQCTAIYLNKNGLECYSFGSLVYKRPMKISDEDLMNAAKAYVFKGKEIVKMTDVYAAISDTPSLIRVDRPDLLIGSTDFIRTAGAAKSGGGAIR